MSISAPGVVASGAASAAGITARLDRLPGSWVMWRFVLLLSLGAFFEFYDLFMTAYLAPGLVRSGIFHPGAQGFFGLSDQATFAAATFAGLFVGTIVFSPMADRLGRRAIFTASLLWYTVFTVAMAAQSTAFGVDLFRFIAGVGIGVELVTIDAYIAELVPGHLRGRAFAVSQCVQFCAVPVVAFLCYLLVPQDPFGIAGWRVVVLIGAVSAIAVWIIRSRVPESPRWLAQKGRLAEADRITSRIEAETEAELGRALPAAHATVAEVEARGRFAEIWQPPYRRRTIMLAVFNFCQTIGFYGFGNWVPSLLESRGITITHSLQYSFIIAIAYPISSLLCATFADRTERKWQIVAAAICTATGGIIFSQLSAPFALIALGVLITMSNNLLSYAYHAYQAELFPTRIRATAVGFVYSWSRLSTVLTSFMIAFFLQNFGSAGVFAFIAAAMAMVVISIGGFGPKTKNRRLEEIAH